MKTELSIRLKWWAYAALASSRRRWKTRKSRWIFGRTACLGLETLPLTGWKLPLLNVQKGRVDVLLGYIKDTSSRPIAAAAATHFARSDIIPLVVQQQTFLWTEARPPAALFMDSFAELTDQLFVHRRTGRQFCANYSDLVHDPLFTEEFECRGLLPAEQIEDAYTRFFSAVRESFGSIPIVFLHYPKTLEHREKFRKRHDQIVDVIAGLASTYEPFTAAQADPNLVRWPENISEKSKFPYHYHTSTYIDLSRQIRSLNLSLR